jgi:hypothetical protein
MQFVAEAIALNIIFLVYQKETCVLFFSNSKSTILSIKSQLSRNYLFVLFFHYM